MDVNTALLASNSDVAQLSGPKLTDAWVQEPRLLSLLLSGGVVGVLFFASVVSPAAQTIVGTWAPDPAVCTPVGGMISIGPMSLTGDEVQCAFRDVARLGEVVTWHGTCADGGTRTPTTVVAALLHGVLSVRMNADPAGTYRRCRPL